MFALLPYRFSFADFKSVFKNRLRFGEKWREPKKCTLFIRGRRINTVMESTRRADSNNTCVAFALLRNFIFRCVRQKRISIRGAVRPSVRPSVGRSVTPVQKPHFSAVFGHGEILHWNKWSTNMFWESFHPSVRPSVSPYICHMINTRWDTARTHRCPVGLVFPMAPNCAFPVWRTEIKVRGIYPEDKDTIHFIIFA